MSLLAFVALAHAQPLVAVVVVDEEAREHGYALELDGWLVDDALPIDVVEGDVVQLVGPDGAAHPLDVAAGEAWEITGPQGEAWMSALQEDVRTDLIAVRGDRASVDALATTLGAEVLVRDGVTYLSGRDVLLDAPWVDDPVAQRVREVRLVRVDEASVAEQPGRSRAALARPASRRGVVGNQAAPTAAPLPVIEPATPAKAAVAPPVAAVAAPTAAVDEVPPGPSVESSIATDLSRVEHDRERYAGLYLCRGTPLLLHPAGVYLLGEHQGSWHVGAPGVVRLQGPEGELWYRAAVEPDRAFCRELWAELEPADEGFSRQRRRALRAAGPR